MALHRQIRTILSADFEEEGHGWFDPVLAAFLALIGGCFGFSWFKNRRKTREYRCAGILLPRSFGKVSPNCVNLLDIGRSARCRCIQLLHTARS